MEIKGYTAIFLQSNTDTDVIIPAKFLKRTSLDGFEQFAFFEKKYDQSTVCEPSLEEKDFVFTKKVLNKDCTLNHPNSKNASFLLTWENFGCGSSREHAVYALNGFKVVIGSAPYGKSAFADIFRDNCRQNLVWTPVISPEDHEKLVQYYELHIDANALEMTLDSDKNTLKLGYLEIPFTIPEAHKNYILKGKNPFDMAKDQISSAVDVIDSWAAKNKTLITSSPNSK